MSHSSAPDTTAFISYTIGIASPEEAASVEQWVADSPRHREILDRARRLITVVHDREKGSRRDAVEAISMALATHVATIETPNEIATGLLEGARPRPRTPQGGGILGNHTLLRRMFIPTAIVPESSSRPAMLCHRSAYMPHATVNV
jgi:hypothetical protein